MKKILSLLLALSMCLALAACGNNENSETAGNASQIVSEEDYSLKTEGTETPEETQRLKKMLGKQHKTARRFLMPAGFSSFTWYSLNEKDSEIEHLNGAFPAVFFCAKFY